MEVQYIVHGNDWKGEDIMGLKIQAEGQVLEYTLTDSYAKPYLKVNSTGVLPLTTNTTNGIRLMVQDTAGNTYRAMRYVSTSESASGSASVSETYSGSFNVSTMTWV